jgi:hypothetical protein
MDRTARLHYQPSVQYFSTHNVLRHNTFCLSSAACAHAHRRTADVSESIPTCNQFSTCVIQNDLCHMLYIYKRRRQSPALPCATRYVLKHVKSAGIYLLSVDDPLHIIDACALFLQNVTSERADLMKAPISNSLPPRFHLADSWHVRKRARRLLAPRKVVIQPSEDL